MSGVQGAAERAACDRSIPVVGRLRTTLSAGAGGAAVGTVGLVYELKCVPLDRCCSIFASLVSCL